MIAILKQDHKAEIQKLREIMLRYEEEIKNELVLPRKRTGKKKISKIKATLDRLPGKIVPKIQ